MFFLKHGVLVFSI